MEESPVTRKTVCIVGLGYVGLPLAEAFSHRVRTLGFDIDARKVQKIKKTQTAVQATSDPTKIREADFVMICVPTLLTPANDPDLSYVRNAAAIVGANMKKGAVVILESTVYPGVTEEVLLPVLENESGLRAGRDFRVGYSPERINPGDDEHVLARTTKIVAGMDRETGDAMAELYSLITRVYRAPDIRTAEAAKVVENIQRDINIALINEFSQMFARMHLNTRDVLDAAATKWNFHPYTPGIVGANMKKGAVVILESTVYPGVTEEVLLPVLENESGLRAGRDFRVGYSPERINPGDDEHVLARTTKIVAGMDRETGDAMAELYSLITRVYRAPDIRTAEAAKVVENIQRDINIALINEFSQMFARMHLNTRDVLDAAATKWNFHPYTPGIVGGHCIPTVPYFLAYAAKRVGYTPRMILAGRATNDFMTKFVADLVISNLKSAGRTAAGSKIAILGLTYKENVPDFRDNPVTDIIRYLGEQGVAVFGYDPLLSPEEIAGMGVAVLPDLARQMDGYILAAPHAQFLEMRREFSAIADPAILFIDIKGVFHRDEQMKKLFNYITL